MSIGTLESAPPGADTFSSPSPALERGGRGAWNPFGAFAVRMACVYLVLAHVLLEALSFTGGDLSWHQDWLTSLEVSWFGLPAARENIGGCGDRANDYLWFGLSAGVAALAALVWTGLDRRRGLSRVGLGYWVSTGLRYYLASEMLMYGAVKVIKSQFPVASPTDLAGTFAEANPQHLMWMFMGYSTSYNVFLGLAELCGGALLLSRRTTLLGALLTSGVMANVFLLNVCYDVCVKLRSAELLAMSVALVAPDARRLFGLFVLNRAVPARDLARPVGGRWVDRVLGVVKVVLIGRMLVFAAFVAYRGWATQGAGAPVSSWEGTWVVQAPADASAVAAEHRNWVLLALDSQGVALVRRADGSRVRWQMRGDDTARTLELGAEGQSTPRFRFTFERPSPDELVLGSLAPASTLRLKRQAPEDTALLGHELRWIRDLPRDR